MGKRTKMVFIAAICVLVLVLPVLGSCAPTPKAAPPPQPGKVVKPASVGMVSFADMSGPARSVSYPAHVGVPASWKYLNDEEGGIDGVPINIIEVDTAYDIKKMRSAYEQYKGEVVTMTAPGQSGFYDALLERFIADKMPVAVNAGGADGFLYPPNGWVYGMINTCDMFGFYGQWVMENWKEARKPKVALLVGDYPGGRFTLFVNPYLESLGIEVVATEIIPMAGFTSGMEQLLRINRTKPDFVFTTIITSQLVVVLEELGTLGIKLGSKEMGRDYELIYCYGFGLDEMAMCRAERFDGLVVNRWLLDYRSYGDPDWPRYTKLVDKYMEMYKIPKYRLAPGPAAFNTGLNMAEAVRQAVKAVGWEKLTSETVGINGYPNIKDFKTGVGPSVTFTLDDPREKQGQLFRVYKDGSYKNLTEWRDRPWVFKWLAEKGLPFAKRVIK